MTSRAITIARVTMPPGGPHFQHPYGVPPAAPAGYGPPPGYPPPGPQHSGYPQPGPPPGGPNGYPPPGGYPSGGPGPTGTRQMQPAPPGQPAPGPIGMAPPGMARGYGPGAIVIDVARADAKKAIIGAIVCGVLGIFATVGGVVTMADGDVGVGIAVLVFGVLLLALTLSIVIRRDKVFRPRKLVFEPAGIRWDDPKGAPWAIPWSELAHVSVNKHSPRQFGPDTLQDKLVDAASDKIMGERAHVRLDLYPYDPSYAGRHPELAHLWELQGVKGGYRFPLGSNVSFIPSIAQAMARFAPHLYRGVNATEGFMGLR